MKMVWYWKEKPKLNEKGKETHLCCGCGDLPIAFHGYKDPRWMYKIDNEIYSEEFGGSDTEKWQYLQFKNANVTLTYLDRVRAAMKELELIT